MLRHASAASKAEKIGFIPSHPLPNLAFAGVPLTLNDLRLSWTAAEILHETRQTGSAVDLCVYSAENLEFNILSITRKLIYSAYPKNNLYRCFLPCSAQSRAHIPCLSFTMGLADNPEGQSISPNTQNGPNTPPNQQTPLLQTNSPMTRYTETPSPTPPPAEKRSAVLIIYATFLGMSLYPKGLIQLFTKFFCRCLHRQRWWIPGHIHVQYDRFAVPLSLGRILVACCVQFWILHRVASGMFNDSAFDEIWLIDCG